MQDLYHSADDLSAAVREFHEKLRVGSMAPLCLDETGDVEYLDNVGDRCIELSQKFDIRNPISCRAHLILEETGELFKALAAKDPVATLDALADLLYVVIGSGVTMDLPLAKAFEEVHRSNMTKSKQSDDPEAPRVRDKGPDYVAPNLDGVLLTHYSQIFSPHLITPNQTCKWCGMSLVELYQARAQGGAIPVCRGGHD